MKVLASLLNRKLVFQNMENGVKYMKDRQNIELICHHHRLAMLIVDDPLTAYVRSPHAFIDGNLIKTFYCTN